MNNNRIIKSKWVLILTVFCVAVTFAAPNTSLAASARVTYVKQQLIKAGLSKTSVNKLFIDKRIKIYPKQKVSYKKPNWVVIEHKLTAPQFIEEGRGYIASHSAAFEKAQADYGVPKGVLAGVIAIETDFGKNSGSYVTFNALYSRMRQWPAASWKTQAGELIALSKYCLNSGLDCFKVKGSYAGAFGLVQFMPSSLLAYGVDGNGDGIINLHLAEDAIPSAANFLKNHGFQENQLLALTRYYGSPVGYPGIVLKFANLVEEAPVVSPMN